MHGNCDSIRARAYGLSTDTQESDHLLQTGNLKVNLLTVHHCFSINSYVGGNGLM